MKISLDENQNGVLEFENETQVELVQCRTCAAKFEYEDEKKFAKQCYACYRDDNTRKQCKVCKKFRIVPDEDGSNWQTICGTCYNESPLKNCVGCHQPNVKSIETWRQLCKECWPKRENYLRICEQCKDRPIKAGAEKWVKTCHKCYLEKRALHFEPCPQCKSTKLIKNKNAPACRPCMLLNGQIKLQEVSMK